MRIICITVGDDSYTRLHGGGPTSMARVRQHFAERGVDAQFFRGIHAAKLGISTALPWSESGQPLDPKTVGCWLSHRAAWAACLLLPDDLFFIIEDDAKFPEDWRARVDQAVQDAGDFDLLYVGSCHALGRPTQHVAGDVFEVFPLCLHAYIVRRSALLALIETSDEARCCEPIDISLALHSLPRLRTRAVLPRIVDQFAMDLPA